VRGVGKDPYRLTPAGRWTLWDGFQTPLNTWKPSPTKGSWTLS
jgi:hypothetical protein